MDLRDLASEPAAKTTRPTGPPGMRWLVLQVCLLDDESFLVVLEKTHLKEARKAYPGKVIYLPFELEELRRLKDAPDYLKALEVIHVVKKKFGAWIIPSDTPLRSRPRRRRELIATDLRRSTSHGLTHEDVDPVRETRDQPAHAHSMSPRESARRPLRSQTGHISRQERGRRERSSTAMVGQDQVSASDGLREPVPMGRTARWKARHERRLQEGQAGA